jgi:hypothetical protein
MINVFDYDHINFVPDSQIIFPSIFLIDVEKIKHPNCVYKECFEILQQYYNYLILPSNDLDFSNVILTKFRLFLRSVESEIRNARNKGTNEFDFYRNTRSLLSSLDYGDLLLYWENKKGVFWSFVSMDHSLVQKRMIKLTNEKLALFAKTCEGHKVIFSDGEQKLSEGLYILIKKLQKEQKVKYLANDADLMILADCLIYNGERVQQGIIYLVTGDKNLRGVASEIVENPLLVFSDLKPNSKLVGFIPLDPEKLVADHKCRSDQK